MEAKVYSLKGEEIKTIELNDFVFGCDVNEGAIYQAVKNEHANNRTGTASTKSRSEVHGSHRKPWRQKGTGRARAGTKQSPIWVGGGVAFGPKPRDYSYNIPKKLKRLAMRSILSQKMKDDKLKILEDFSVESGKTRDLVNLLKNITDGTRTVLILKDDDKMTKRAGSNIPWLRFLSYNRLSAKELFYGKQILLLETAAQRLNEFYASKKLVESTDGS